MNAQIKMDCDGKVIIGSTSNPAKNLDVRGPVQFIPDPSSTPDKLIIDDSGYNGSPALYPYNNYSGNIGKSGNAFKYIICWDLQELSADARQKENIKDINHALDIILNLKGVRYDLKKEFTYINPNITDLNIIDKMEEERKDKIGFLAQDVEKILPEVVYYDDSSDIYSISYTKIIPVLVEAIKEQQIQIEELKSLINNDPKLKSTDENDLNTASQLFQNQPNPFNENTVINYYIPEGNQKAVVYIYDLQGLQKKAYNITTKGNSNIVINGSELQPGMYIYTLIVNGEEVDTKRMILTD